MKEIAEMQKDKLWEYIIEENSSYFLCSKRNVPKLVDQAKVEASKLLKDFEQYYNTGERLKIDVEPGECFMGWYIGGKLLFGDSIVLEEKDIGLIFLQLNELILRRLIEAGVGPSEKV